MTDPISDLLTRLRNASKAKLDECVIPHSTLKEAIAAKLGVASAQQPVTSPGRCTLNRQTCAGSVSLARQAR